MEIVPCSRVGHIFRKKLPYSWRNGIGQLNRNKLRLAKVWMDEYSKFFQERIRNEVDDIGDISTRIALREKLNCRGFKWYLEKVFPELKIPVEAVAMGEVSFILMVSDVESLLFNCL